MFKQQVICDVCGRTTTVDQYDPKKEEVAKGMYHIRIPVIFHCSQEDGSYRDPYISMETLCICEDCLKKSIHLHGNGVQGNNEYWVEN